MAEKTTPAWDSSTFERLMERITNTAVELSSIGAQLDIYSQQRSAALEKIEYLKNEVSSLQTKLKMQDELLRNLETKSETCIRLLDTQRDTNNFVNASIETFKSWKTTISSVQRKMVEAHDDIDAQFVDIHASLDDSKESIADLDAELRSIQAHLDDIDKSINQISEILTEYKMMLVSVKRIVGFIIGFVTFISILSSIGVFEMFKMYFFSK